MSLSITTESYGGGDFSWLGSSHGVANAQSGTLSAAAFPAGAFADGVVPSGQPVALVGGVFVPYNAAGADGSQNLRGFVIGNQSVANGDTTAGILEHGFVVLANLPATVDAAALPASIVGL